MDNTPQNPESQQEAANALEELRKSFAAIETKYSSPELMAQVNQFLQQKGFVTAPRGKARKTTREKGSGFATPLNIAPAFFVPSDLHIIRYFLIDLLFRTGHEIVLGEFAYMKNICDVLAVVGGRAIEFEIKASRSDYFADFEKTIFIGKPVSKHGALANGSTMISKFYFVVPANMVDIRECPAHAGLIWYTLVGDVPMFRVVKYPALLHKNYLSPGTWQTIAKRLMIRCRNLTDRYSNTRFAHLKAQHPFYAHSNTPNPPTDVR